MQITQTEQIAERAIGKGNRAFKNAGLEMILKHLGSMNVLISSTIGTFTTY